MSVTEKPVFVAPPNTPVDFTTSGISRALIRDFLDGNADGSLLPEPHWGPIGKEVYERTYSRDLPIVNADGNTVGHHRETWAETVRRVVNGSLSYVDPVHWQPDEDVDVFDLIYNFKAIPAGRHLWVTGTDVARFSKNCWASGHVARTSAHFGFLAARLFEGGGVGSNYSSDLLAATAPVVGSIDVSFACRPDHKDYAKVSAATGDTLDAETPCALRRADGSARYQGSLYAGTINAGTIKTATRMVVDDSREGWVDVWVRMIDLGTQPGHHSITIDVSNVRPYGTPLKTFGGTASGPEALVIASTAIAGVLNGAAAEGRHLTGLEAMQIDHEVASAVVSGGSRRCLPAGARVHTSRGSVRIEDVQVGDIVQTPAGEAPVTAVFDQGRQATIRIAHEFGVLECTPNHRVAVFDSLTSWTFKEARDITPLDHLVWDFNGCEGDKGSALPPHDAVTTLPVLGDHRRANGRPVTGMSRFNTSCYVDGCPDRAQVMTPQPICNRHYLRQKMHGNPLIVKARRTQISIPELDADTAWFIGLLHGDGNVGGQGTSRGIVSVACDPEYPMVISDAKTMLGRFGVDYVSTYGPKPGAGCVRVVARRLELARWMAENVKTAHSPLSVPEYIWQGTREVRAAYLAGVFDADGSWKTRHFQIVTTCYEGFASDLVRVAASLGIAAYKEPRRKADNPEGWQATWAVNVAGRESLDMIDSWFGVYSRKYENVGRTVEGHKGFGFSKEFGRRQGLEVYGGEGNLKYSVRVTERLGKTVLPAWPVAVLGIESGREDVQTYDIEVDGLHQFTAEGLVVHNSARMSLMSWKDPQIFEFIHCKADPTMHWTTNISVEIDDDFHDALADPAHLLHSRAEEVLAEVATGMTRDGEPGMVDTSAHSADEPLPIRITNPCSEASLQSYGSDQGIYGESCNLGSVDLAAFGTDTLGAHRAFELMARFLFRATLNPHRDPAASAIEATNRRIGVGIMGLQGWVAAHGYRLSELASSPDLAATLTDFRFSVRLAADQFAVELGLPRPVKVTAVAPTGSIAQLGGTTPGIHPVYARHFIRRVRYQDADRALPELAAAGHTIVDDIYAANTKVVEFIMRDGILDQYPAALIEQADEFSAEDFFDLIAVVQRTFCGPKDGQAVSATAQIPLGSDPAELANLIRSRLGVMKGFTVFPATTRPLQPYEALSEEAYRQAAAAGQVAIAGDSNSGECAGGSCPIR